MSAYRTPYLRPRARNDRASYEHARRSTQQVFGVAQGRTVYRGNRGVGTRETRIAREGASGERSSIRYVQDSRRNLAPSISYPSSFNLVLG